MSTTTTIITVESSWTRGTEGCTMSAAPAAVRMLGAHADAAKAAKAFEAAKPRPAASAAQTSSGPRTWRPST